MLDIIKEKFEKLVRENGLETEEMAVYFTRLSPQEAIGEPAERDYLLLERKERLLQAVFEVLVGQAYTDMPGSFSGRLSDIIKMELKTNRQRTMMVSAVNAVMRFLGSLELPWYIVKMSNLPNVPKSW